jgi:hypothetical protein
MYKKLGCAGYIKGWVYEITMLARLFIHTQAQKLPAV